MARECIITGKRVLTGNNVSHANNKTKKRFLPNLQTVTIITEKLGKVRLRMTPHGLRTLEAHGGLEGFLLNSSKKSLNKELLPLKKRLSILTASQ